MSIRICVVGIFTSWRVCGGLKIMSRNQLSLPPCGFQVQTQVVRLGTHWTITLPPKKRVLRIIVWHPDVKLLLKSNCWETEARTLYHEGRGTPALYPSMKRAVETCSQMHWKAFLLHKGTAKGTILFFRKHWSFVAHRSPIICIPPGEQLGGEQTVNSLKIVTHFTSGVRQRAGHFQSFKVPNSRGACPPKAS